MILLEDTSVDVLTWFKTMRWKQILINTIYLCAKTGLCDIQGSRKQTLLGVLFDNKLTFDKHIEFSVWLSSIDMDESVQNIEQ